MRVIEAQTSPTTLRVSIAYPALSPAQVYARWTQPDSLCRWWPETADLDARVGGVYALGWPSHGWTLRGEYLAVVPDRVLRFTWAWDHEDDATRIVTVLLEPSGPGGTRLDLEHGPYQETPSDQVTRVESHLAGWRYVLPRLGER